MAFDDVTFFEVHLDGTTLGVPGLGTAGSTTADETTGSPAPASAGDRATTASADGPPRSGRRKRRYLVLLGLLALGAVALSRRGRDGGRSVDVRVDDGQGGGAEAEPAPEQ
jgi:hypothetical protein